jgi:hypothetical protein
MELPEFEDNFTGYEPPPELIQLKNFQDNYPDYSEGFFLLANNKSGIKTYSDHKDFLSRFIPFAQANGSGSTYAIWINETDKTLSELPIVVFGDEGGVHVVAENALQLMHLLTYDSEIMVDWHQAYFYKGEDNYESDDQALYKSWLKKNFKLDPITDPNKIIKQVQEKYKAGFDEWFGRYYKY